MLTKAHTVKAMVFPTVRNGCESWTIKKTEHQRIDAFELWCWKSLESPLDGKEFKAVHPKGLDSKLKSRDITLPAKVHLVKAMVFPVVMYGC